MNIDDISRVKPLVNHVLVKITENGNSSIKLSSLDLKINTSFNPELHTDPRGIVVAVPDFLEEFAPGRVSNYGFMPYHTPIEVVPGDVVWFDYLTYLESMSFLANPMSDYKLPKYIISGGEVYIFVHYSKLYMKQGVHKKEMLNGWMQVEYLANPRLVIQARVKEVAVKIISVGSRNTRYASGAKDDPIVREGEFVLLKKRYGIRKLEPWKEEGVQIKEICLAPAKDVVCQLRGDLSGLYKTEEVGEFKAQTMRGLQFQETKYVAPEKRTYKGR